MKTLAIFSPNQNAYSETFIQAHKQLPFNVRFYYGGHLPQALENGSMIDLPFNLRLKKRLQKGYSPKEKKLMFSLLNEKVDIVLAEYGPTAVESLSVLKYLHIPLIVHFHGYDASVSEVLNSYKEGYLKVFHYAKCVIAVSKAMQRALIEMGCPQEKIAISTYGPASEFFDVQPHYQSKRFIAIGRFVDKKAPHLTILAFRKVAKIYPEASLIMVGDGPLLQACKDLVRHFELENRIQFKGILQPEQIRNEMCNSMAFVQHSVTASNGDMEGTPVAVLESQAAGLPVVSTFHAGIPDVVTHEKTGLLCEEGNVEQMAQNMLRLLSQNEMPEKFGQAARLRIKESFTLERHLSCLKHEIEKGMAVHC